MVGEPPGVIVEQQCPQHSVGTEKVGRIDASAEIAVETLDHLCHGLGIGLALRRQDDVDLASVIGVALHRYVPSPLQCVRRFSSRLARNPQGATEPAHGHRTPAQVSHGGGIASPVLLVPQSAELARHLPDPTLASESKKVAEPVEAR